MAEELSQKVEPYQKGDFIKDENGRAVQYRGPIYHVTYPPQADDMAEMEAWAGLGYQLQLGFSYDREKGFTLSVMGDIPEYIQRRFKQKGIKVRLAKERGPVIDID